MRNKDRSTNDKHMRMKKGETKQERVVGEHTDFSAWRHKNWTENDDQKRTSRVAPSDRGPTAQCRPCVIGNGNTNRNSSDALGIEKERVLVEGGVGEWHRSCRQQRSCQFSEENKRRKGAISPQQSTIQQGSKPHYLGRVRDLTSPLSRP